MSLTTAAKRAAAGLFLLALPVLFGTFSLRWLVSDAGGIHAGFEKHGASARTGISPEELKRVAQEISRYLLLQRPDIDITVGIAGQPQALFNDREINHMKDVRDLLGRFYVLQAAGAAYALAYLLGGAGLMKGRFWPVLGSRLRWGGALTLGLFGGLGALSMLNFDDLFLQFHLVSFDNDLWMLDPAKDRLIMLVPRGFWYDVTMRFALLTGAQAVAAVLLGTVLARMRAVGPKKAGRRGRAYKGA